MIRSNLWNEYRYFWIKIFSKIKWKQKHRQVLKIIDFDIVNDIAKFIIRMIYYWKKFTELSTNKTLIEDNAYRCSKK